MPFLSPNQQRQSTEGKSTEAPYYYYYYYYYIRLMAFFFQDNFGKLAPDKQNHSGKTNLDLLE